METEKIVSTEVLTVKHANQFWAVSQAEASEFLKRGLFPVSVLSFGVQASASDAKLSQRSGLLFVGPALDTDSPNGSGLCWYNDHVRPLLQTSKPAAKKTFWPLFGKAKISTTLTHAGINRIANLLNPSETKCLGQITDLAPLYHHARVFIAPIKFGSGIPLKVIEAAAHGVPIVATSYIANQLGWRNEVELLVADDAQLFADQISRLLHDDSLWMKLRQNALGRVLQDFPLKAFQDKLQTLINRE